MSYEPIPDHLLEGRWRFGEKNDCTVIAFAIIFNMSYDDAHHHLKEKCGRKNGKGLMDITTIPSSLFDIKHEIIPFIKDGKKITLGRFIKENPVGKYYVCVRGHALAVVDGVVYDYYYGPKRKVEWIMKVY